MKWFNFPSFVSSVARIPILGSLIPHRVKGILDDSSVILWEYAWKRLSANSPYEMLEVHIESILWKEVLIRKDIDVTSLLPEKDIHWCPVFQKWWKIWNLQIRRQDVESKNGKWDIKVSQRQHFCFTYTTPQWTMFEFFDVSQETFAKIFRGCFNLSKHIVIDYSKKDTQ